MSAFRISILILIGGLIHPSQLYAGGVERIEPWGCLFELSLAMEGISKLEISKRLDSVRSRGRIKEHPTLQQAQLLIVLVEFNEPVNLHRLASRVGVTNTVARGRIKSFKKKGWIRENPETHLIEITELGKDWLRYDRILSGYRVSVSKLGKPLSKNERYNHERIPLTNIIFLTELFLSGKKMAFSELTEKMHEILSADSLRDALHWFDLSGVVKKAEYFNADTYQITDRGAELVKTLWKMDRAFFDILNEKVPSIMLSW